ESTMFSIWDLVQDRMVLLSDRTMVSPRFTGSPSRAAFSAQGDLLALSYADRLTLLSLPLGRKLFQGQLPSYDSIETLNFSPDGKQLAVGGSSGALSVMSTQSPYASKLQQDRTFEGKLAGVRFSPDGGSIACWD